MTAGIRWRIDRGVGLLRRACSSMSSKNDTTAIVTAADAEHTSFGCEEDRDLTWFGEAFLKDALPRQRLARGGLSQGERGLIAQREDAEHQTHSNPQLFVGEPMQREARRARGRAAPARASGTRFTVQR